MKNLIEIKKDLQVSEWKNNIKDSSSLPLLQERLDLAEKNQKKPFTDFSDVEMIQWFLYRKEHLNREHDKSQRTINEYERELTQFVELLVRYSEEIDIDMEHIIEGSLFKSLSPRHIRRYQEWLAEKVPMYKRMARTLQQPWQEKQRLLKTSCNLCMKWSIFMNLCIKDYSRQQ